MMIDVDLKPLVILLSIGIGALIGVCIGLLSLIASFWVTVPAWVPIGIVVVCAIIGGIKGNMEYR